jgi:putative acetyltransferase
VENLLAFGQKHEAKKVDALRNSEIFIPQLSMVALKSKNIGGHILLSIE